MKQITREALAKVPQPEFTKTWSPWHHTDVLQRVDTQLQEIGLEPIGERLEVGKHPEDMFGTIQVAGGDDKALNLGFRNSMRKSFGLGFVAGETIYVCSNLGFYGDFLEVRIHNARLTSEALDAFVANAIKAILERVKLQESFMGYLKATPLSVIDFKALTFDAMATGVIPPARLGEFVLAYEAERDLKIDMAAETTQYTFYGAVTRLLRDGSLNTTMNRTRALDTFMQGRVDFDAGLIEA